MMKSTSGKSTVVISIIAFVLISWPSNSFGWGAAHGYITEAVADLGLDGIQAGVYSSVLAEQSYWADGHEPEDFKGTVGIDEEINPPLDLRLGGADPDHWLDIFNFDRGIPPSGEAHNDFALFIGNAKKAFAEGKRDDGFVLLGRGIHYLEDIGMPYHTVLWENLDFLHGHSAYESWADEQWTKLDLARWVKDGASFSHEVRIHETQDYVIELARVSRTYLDRIKQGKWEGDTKATQELMFHVGQYVAAAFRYTAPAVFTFPRANSGGEKPAVDPAAGGCVAVGGPSGLPLATLIALMVPFAYFIRRKFEAV